MGEKKEEDVVIASHPARRTSTLHCTGIASQTQEGSAGENYGPAYIVLASGAGRIGALGELHNDPLSLFPSWLPHWNASPSGGLPPMQVLLCLITN